jgi:2-amino-4-hydroxy-6-hydroxymethyldihydropteridine diphosphokinase
MNEAAMARVYLGLGSNVKAEENLRLGIAELTNRFGELNLSAVYRSAAVGFEGADFLNLVVGLSSDLTPAVIHAEIEIIHNLAGRERGAAKYSSRPLDIDLLLYGKQIIAEPPVHVPRSDILEFGFVLRPLAELAPNLMHPETGQSMAMHWQQFDAEGHLLTPVSLRLQ